MSEEMDESIIPLTEKQVPTILGLDPDSKLVIGESARDRGLDEFRTARQFKMDLGHHQDDSQYTPRRTAAGRNIKAKPKPYWAASEDAEAIRSFTPLEATEEFLKLLIPQDGGDLKQLVIGEPALEGSWGENFRSNIRKVMAKLGFDEPLFLYEPFAIYQYYRAIAGKIVDVDRQQTILVVDIGGGTFDCCVVQTTQRGQLSRSGANSVPLGVKSTKAGGVDLDKKLCNLIFRRTQEAGLKFKESPVARASTTRGLLIIEDAKIKLSNLIRATEGAEGGDEESRKILKDLKVHVSLPPGSFHASETVEFNLSGEDLFDQVKNLWNRKWGNTLIDCINTAEKKLNSKFPHIDAVIVAGGSAQLPFTNNYIRSALIVRLSDDTQIVSGRHLGSEVAQGLAVECKELSKKHSSLVTNQLVACFHESIYLQVGRNSKEKIIPTVKAPKYLSHYDNGLLYGSKGALANKTIKCGLQIKKQPKGVLHYWFYGSAEAQSDPLNVMPASMNVRIPGGKEVDNKFDLELKVTEEGEVTPIFQFYRKGKNLDKIIGHPFYLTGSLLEGKKYLGVDFGTCNSYVSELLIPESKQDPASYPVYEILQSTRRSLISLEERCTEFRESVGKESLLDDARERNEYFVFHNNKIEGNTLTIGQTQQAIRSGQDRQASEADQEAVNLNNAYLWMLDNHDAWSDQFASYVRTLNQKLREGLSQDSGSFREQDVDIAGVEFNPPPWGSVDPYILKLAEELRGSKSATSGLELAVRAHTKLVSIHPFVDGNGRTARLLMNAILLDYGLPVLVLNSSDKQRYFAALEKSNQGSLDALLVLFAGILVETLARIREREESLKAKGVKEKDPRRDSEIDIHPDLQPTITKEGDCATEQVKRFYEDLVTDGGEFPSVYEKEKYKKVIMRNNRYVRLCDVNAPQGILENEMVMLEEAIDDYVLCITRRPSIESARTERDAPKVDKRRVPDKSEAELSGQKPSKRLKTLLKQKRKGHGETLAVYYPAWKSAFEMLRQEFKSIANDYDADPAFQETGCELRFEEFDILDEERFDSLWTRREVSRTWFFSLALSSGFRAARILFQFGRRSDKLTELEPHTAPVSCVLTIGGDRTEDWRDLSGELIQLREIGYAGGRLVYLDVDQEIVETTTHVIFDTLIENLIQITD